MNYSELLQHILRQYSLYLYNVRILTKVLLQRFFTSPYPDFHFGIHIKCTGSFYRKTFIIRKTKRLAFSERTA